MIKDSFNKVAEKAKEFVNDVKEKFDPSSWGRDGDRSGKHGSGDKKPSTSRMGNDDQSNQQQANNSSSEGPKPGAPPPPSPDSTPPPPAEEPGVGGEGGRGQPPEEEETPPPLPGGSPAPDVFEDAAVEPEPSGTDFFSKEEPVLRKKKDSGLSGSASSSGDAPITLAQLYTNRQSLTQNAAADLLSRVGPGGAGRNAGFAEGGVPKPPPGSTQHERDARGIGVNSRVLGNPSEQGAGARQRQEVSRLAASQDFIEAAELKLRYGDFSAGLDDADQAIRSAPKSAAGYIMKAKLLNRMGRYREAEVVAVRAAQLGGSDAQMAEAMQELAWSELNQGRYKDSMASASNAVAYGSRAGANGVTARALATRAYACEVLGDTACLKADLAQASKLDPRYAEQLKRAEAGERVFDPEAGDSWRLLEAVSAMPGRGGVPWGAAGAAGLLLAAAGGVFLWRRRRPAPGAAIAQGLGVAPAPAPAPKAQEKKEDSGLVAGKYQLTRVIGTGPGGQVWEAHDHTLGRAVAVKRLQIDAGVRPNLTPAPGQDAEARAQRLQVARALASLSHPHVVDVYEVLDLPAGLHLVMENITGKTFAQLRGEGRLALKDIKGLFQPVCSALEYAHGRGVSHRNITPSNLMVSNDGFVKLMEFSLRAQVGNGTHYAAPEARQGILGPEGDLYSLGVCLYEMAVGQPPPPAMGGPGTPAPTGLGPEFDRFMAQALASDPSRRFQSVREFAAALDSLPEPVPPA